MNNRLTKILSFIIVILTLAGIFKYDLLSYLLMQGEGQLKVLYQARSIEEVIDDPTTSDSLRANILLVKEIKDFAEVKLGLEANDLYNTLYDQKGKDILWNLSACEPFQMKSLEWTYPIVGEVSYKGFFDLNRARAEEEELKAKGYDTRIRPVNAWSTLGWFNDPILSKTLKRSKGSIVELFIHEITHANVFIKDSLTFNENLASFIGEQGAFQFLKEKYGQNDAEYLAFVTEEEDMRKFITHCLNGVNELNLLYQKLTDEMSEEDKYTAKKEYLEHWVYQLDTISFADTTHFRGRFSKRLPNNAFFMGFERYDSKKIILKRMLESRFNGDLRSMIEYYKKSQ